MNDTPPTPPQPEAIPPRPNDPTSYTSMPISQPEPVAATSVPVPQPPYPVVTPDNPGVEKKSGKKSGVAAFVLGIISFVTGLIAVIAIPVAIAGIVVGIVALAKRTAAKARAIVGLVLSILALLIGVFIGIPIAAGVVIGIENGVMRNAAQSEGRLATTPCFSFSTPKDYKVESLIPTQSATESCNVIMTKNDNAEAQIAIFSANESVNSIKEFENYISKSRTGVTTTGSLAIGDVYYVTYTLDGKKQEAIFVSDITSKGVDDKSYKGVIVAGSDNGAASEDAVDEVARTLQAAN